MKIRWYGMIGLLFLVLLLFILIDVESICADTGDNIDSWQEQRLTSIEAVPSCPFIAESKHGYGLVWTDGRNENDDLYFKQIYSRGRSQDRFGDEVRLTDNQVHDETPAIVWNGEDYGIFWSYSKSAIYFTKVSEQGEKLVGDIPTVTSTQGYAIHISAVWNDTKDEYGVTWWDGRQTPPCTPSGTRGRAFFVRVSQDGNKIGEEIPVADAFSNPWRDYHPYILWDGSNYAVFWNDDRENGECITGIGDIYMAKVNSSGVKILGDIKLQSIELSPQLTDVLWDGENYVIGYNGRIGTGHIAKMDTNGNTVFVDIPINTSGMGGNPQLSIYSNHYYLSWTDYRDRTPETFYNSEIYYTITDKLGNKLIPETRMTYKDGASVFNTSFVFVTRNTGIAWLDDREGSQQIYFASKEIDRRVLRESNHLDR